MKEDDGVKLARLIGKPLTPDDVADLRRIVARQQERATVDLRFALMVERYREANPAAVSPGMGFA